MSKTYTMPTWEEFLTAHPASSGSKQYAEVRGYTFEEDYTVVEETYEAIREALAVEQPDAKPTEDVELRKVEDLAHALAHARARLFQGVIDPEVLATVKRQIDAIMAPPSPEAERLVGKARGEPAELGWTDPALQKGMHWRETIQAKGSGSDWRDAGGGEEKLLRKVGEKITGHTCKPDTEPVADRPNCINCHFMMEEPRELGFVARCRRMPPVVVGHRKSEHPQVSSEHWCGEWRAKA